MTCKITEMLLCYVNSNGFYSLNMQAVATTMGSTQLSQPGKLCFPQLGGLLTPFSSQEENNTQAVRAFTAFTPWAVKLLDQ